MRPVPRAVLTRGRRCVPTAMKRSRYVVTAAARSCCGEGRSVLASRLTVLAIAPTTVKAAKCTTSIGGLSIEWRTDR